MRRHLEIRGRVQGVGFRWFVRETARRLDLAGWVRNRDNGVVEVAVEGSEDGLGRFLIEVEQGPPGAVVDALVDLPVDPSEPLSHPFSVKRE